MRHVLLLSHSIAVQASDDTLGVDTTKLSDGCWRRVIVTCWGREKPRIMRIGVPFGAEVVHEETMESLDHMPVIMIGRFFTVVHELDEVIL